MYLIQDKQLSNAAEKSDSIRCLHDYNIMF